MKRQILTLAAIVTFIAGSLAFITADEPKYKNLKILKKNISKKELDSVMHFFATSLGQRCTFCHVRDEAAKSMDFASDANPNKGVARFMMRMNAKLNKKYFKNAEKNPDDQDRGNLQAVTCYTCHHGESFPLVKPKPVRNDSTRTPSPAIMKTMPADSMKKQ